MCKRKITLPLLLGCVCLSLLLTACGGGIDFLSDADERQDNTESEFTYTHSDDVPVDNNATIGVFPLQYSDGAIYFHNYYAPAAPKENRSFVRLNPATGNVTFVCSDPLCTHTTVDCNFYGMRSTYYVKDGFVFFSQYTKQKSSDGVSRNVGDHRAVDLESGEVYIKNKIDTENYTEYAKQLIVDNFVFYYEPYYIEEKDEISMALHRWDRESGEIKVLHDRENIFDTASPYALAMSDTILFETDSRIYFTDTKTIYSTDLNYENRIDHAEGTFPYEVLTDGEYIYYGVEYQSEYGIRPRFHRMNLDGSGDIDLGFDCQNYALIITSEYLYYGNGDKVSVGKNGISGYSGEEVVMRSSEIRRCRHDGSEKETVFKFEGEYEKYRLTDMCVVGNYIYGTYEYYEDADGDGILEDGEHHSGTTPDRHDIMRIDVTTGEVYIIDGII